MQALELVLIASGVLVAAAVLAARVRGIGTFERRWSRALLGIIPGAIGAVIILVTRLDFVPDDLEGPAWTISLVIVSVIAAAITTYRLAAR